MTRPPSILPVKHEWGEEMYVISLSQGRSQESNPGSPHPDAKSQLLDHDATR